MKSEARVPHEGDEEQRGQSKIAPREWLVKAKDEVE